MAVFLQLLQNTIPVYIQQFFRIVLGRKGKSLVYFYGQIHIGEQLILDLPLHSPDDILLDQSGTEQIYPQIVLALGGRNFLHGGLLHDIINGFIQF